MIRFNKRCYDRRRLTEGGIKHIDLFYEDGGNPSEDILQRFLKICEITKARNQSLALHGQCKMREPNFGQDTSFRRLFSLLDRRLHYAVSTVNKRLQAYLPVVCIYHWGDFTHSRSHDGLRRHLSRPSALPNSGLKHEPAASIVWPSESTKETVARVASVTFVCPPPPPPARACSVSAL